jgi:hypothetical protein
VVEGRPLLLPRGYDLSDERPRRTQLSTLNVVRDVAATKAMTTARLNAHDGTSSSSATHQATILRLKLTWQRLV